MTYTAIQFLEKIKPMVIADMQQSKILASLTAAQALIESGRGNSQLADPPNNNLFGMKGTYRGQSVSMKTQEYIGGKYITITASFRKYPSWAESIADHSALFNTLGRYANLRGERDYRRACTNVRLDGYATSPTYSNALIRVIEQYHLDDWDRQPVTLEHAVSYAGMITASWLNVRKGPGAEHDVVKNSEGEPCMLPYGLIVAIGGERAGWLRLQGTNYWVSAQYVRHE